MRPEAAGQCVTQTEELIRNETMKDSKLGGLLVTAPLERRREKEELRTGLRGCG